MKRFVFSIIAILSLALVTAGPSSSSSGSSSKSPSSSSSSSSRSSFSSSSSKPSTSSGSSKSSWGSSSSFSSKSSPASSPSSSVSSKPSTSSGAAKTWGSSATVSKTETAKPAASPSVSSFSSSSSSDYAASEQKKNPRLSATDIAAKQKVAQTGAAATTKTEALSDFKKKNSDKFVNKFDKEPPARPNYIPPSTSVGGNSYTVVYNPGYHGYGYYNSLGAWVMYDAMSDAIMLSALASQNQTVVYEGGTRTVYRNHVNPIGGVLIACLLIGIVVFFILKLR